VSGGGSRGRVAVAPSEDSGGGLKAKTSIGSRRDVRLAIICAVAVVIAVVTSLVPRFTQPEAYHHFADREPALGVPNFFNVASNLGFLVVGLMGLYFVVRGTQSDGRPAFADPSERWSWGVVFGGTAATCLGSGFYHLAPDSPRLAWDRLPMAVAFMGIVAAVVSERVSATAGRRMLVPLVLGGSASVWYWRWSASRGVENLNPYGAVQYGSLLLLLLLIALFPSRYTRGRDTLVALAWYGLAKAAEYFDQAIFVATGDRVSGHTLKHLLAALAIFWLLRMLALRRPVSATADAIGGT
jgi:hypothetical protein